MSAALMRLLRVDASTSLRILPSATKCRYCSTLLLDAKSARAQLKRPSVFNRPPQNRGRADVVPRSPDAVGRQVLPPGKRQNAVGQASTASTSLETSKDVYDCPRNPVGVQLLSESLKSQVFPSTAPKIPAIQEEALSLSQHHLKVHGLDPEQTATLPQIAFDLPPLEGKDLAHHFWNLGREAAQPWLGMAHKLASTRIFETIPTGIEGEKKAGEGPKDEADEGSLSGHEWIDLDASVRAEFHPRAPAWLKTPGWVRYPVLTSKDGKARALGQGEKVEYPLPSDGAMAFDVECMVKEGPFAVMATAAGAKAWYAWLSPWLLQEGERCHEKEHLIRFGPDGDREKQPARLLIGHNVGYDRARVRDEYSLDRTNIRWLDTMSLHVATHGISSPQRGAWLKHSRVHAMLQMLEKDDIEDSKKEVIRAMLGGAEIEDDLLAELDLETFIGENQDSGGLQFTGSDIDLNTSTPQAQTWQDITSKNSLADVAKLHCNITLSKDTRDVFVNGDSRDEIVERLDELLTYCAKDTLITQKVFTKVWPAFVKNCPNPVTAAGVFGLGSTILPVDDQWLEYIQRCEEIYKVALQKVRNTLIELAQQLKEDGTRGISWHEAMSAAEVYQQPESSESAISQRDGADDKRTDREKLWWEHDPWAVQLDWTPKKPKKIQKADVSEKDSPLYRADQIPKWYREKVLRSPSGLGRGMAITPAILRLHLGDKPIVKRDDGTWVAINGADGEEYVIGNSPLRKAYIKSEEAEKLESRLGATGSVALQALRCGRDDNEIRTCLTAAAKELIEWARDKRDVITSDAHLRSLDWTAVDLPEDVIADDGEDGSAGSTAPRQWWPKWYHDLVKPATGELEVTIRSKIAPLLLRLAWQGCPLHHSREHGWVFRYDPQSKAKVFTRQKPLAFTLPADHFIRYDVESTVAQRLERFARTASADDSRLIEPASITPVYYKVPHAAGDDSNVGSPFAKGFIPLFEKGTLQSEHPDERGRQAAKSALDTNASCSYWIGVRDRVEKQLVVWDGQGGSQMNIEAGVSGIKEGDEKEKARRKGIILPQVVPMGTVTRRAIEKTWLTASNAKANRVGSELKSMVKAPPGWSIVGADVDSQELWICSVMGDAQFGFHGATAVGWMTLEGSKSQGTDLHSKTAQILGTGRNQAKVFNYSRIYGAGIRHSSQLLLKATPDMSMNEATRKAKELYASTKGTNTKSSEYFGRRFWYGGTESFVFNKLESIAQEEKPQTPALDCGVTAALKRKYLPGATQFSRSKFGGKADQSAGQDFMPSRINWVVQSSGVDYLHLLITAMEHLMSKYSLRARFMLSVHDEVRYLARDEDVHRVALALQIANLWTRAMFAQKLQMESLPQGVAFFAQVDIDKVLRKEADDPCVTPSHPDPLPAGKAFDIYQTLKHTNGGSLYQDGRSMSADRPSSRQDRSWLVPEGFAINLSSPGYTTSKQTHRIEGTRGLKFLQAQASSDLNEIAALEHRLQVAERKADLRLSPLPVRGTVRAPNAASHRNTARHRHPSAPSAKTRMATAGVHTMRSAPTTLPLFLQEIVAGFPPLHRRLRVPFFKTREHRFHMKWRIYRQLLRACDKTLYPMIYAAIRHRMRAERHNTSPKLTGKLSEKAEFYLCSLRKARDDDERAQSFLETEERRFARNTSKSRTEAALDKHLRAVAEESKTSPRLSGHLLPPSLYNPPLLRYKPVQPLHITMMIKKRRLARQRRQESFLDSTERINLLHSEAQIWSQLPSHAQSVAFGSAQSWAQELEQSERMPMRASFRREVARAKMVYGARMLRAAKLARRAKISSRIRRKRILASLAEKQAEARHEQKE